MMKQIFSLIKKGWMMLMVLSLGLFIACSDDDDPKVEAPIASFQFTVSETNFLEVTFENFSQNATSYSWDFGDGNTSTEENPVHTYAEAGNYTVILTASNEAGDATKEESITITDPDAQLTLLAGTVSKEWIMQREEIAIFLGPSAYNAEWWSFGGATPLGDRPCILDDVYTFERAGGFLKNTNGTFFMDQEQFGGWNDADIGEGCVDETTANAFTTSSGGDYSALADGGSYTYTFDTNADPATITIEGQGAYMGLAKTIVDGDLGPNSTLPGTTTFTVLKLVEGSVADSLHLLVNGVWTYLFVSYHNAGDIPAIPVAEPSASFTSEVSDLTVTFTNTSQNATTYAWDFGDGNTSTEENPVHTYAADGNYTVKLTASDDAGNSDETTAEITVSSAALTMEALSSANGKVWKLALVDQAYKVGSFAGGSDWWGVPLADLEGDRSCQMDDEFIFFTDGSYSVDTKGSSWQEGHVGVDPAACTDDGDLPGVYAGLGSSTDYTFTFTAATDTENAKITVTGAGAYIGFNKGYNGGEYNGSDTELKGSVTYEVLTYINDGAVERMDVAVDISGAQDGTAWWTMTMEYVIQ